jgi:hypothetical protein
MYWMPDPSTTQRIIIGQMIEILFYSEKSFLGISHDDSDVKTFLNIVYLSSIKTIDKSVLDARPYYYTTR